MIKEITVILGLQTGDEGKGAVIYSLSKKPEYDICMRVNGGSNSGHTVYHNGKKFVTHQVPTGIFHGKVCIIGNGCVVNLRKLYDEITELEAIGVSCKDKIFVAKNAHIIMPEHIQEEEKESRIGTTRQGIGPCYRDKYARIGYRFDTMGKVTEHSHTENIWCEGVPLEFFTDMTIDLYEFLYNSVTDFGILVEGAQGFYLDIDHGDYPYVSSSHSSVAGALLNCLPFNKVRKVYGVIKAYETYVGAMKFQPNDPIFNKLADLGFEFGATTGRRRQCNWIDLERLIKAIQINCVTDLIISKCDILRELNSLENDKYWKIKVTGEDSTEIYTFVDEEEFKSFLETEIWNNCNISDTLNIQFKYGPEQEIIL